MYINGTVLLIIQILLIILFLATIRSSYKNGAIATLVSLVSTVIVCIIGWPISESLAKMIPLNQVTISEKYKFINDFFSYSINRIIWYIIFVIVVVFVLRILFKFTRKINNIAILGNINRFLGLLLGIGLTLVYAAAFTLVFNSILFKNGSDIVQNSILKYYEPTSNLLLTSANESLSKTKFTLNYLKDNDSKISVEDFQKIKDIIEFKNTNQEEIKQFLEKKGMSEAEIKKLLPHIK